MPPTTVELRSPPPLPPGSRTRNGTAVVEGSGGPPCPHLPPPDCSPWSAVMMRSVLSHAPRAFSS